MTGLQGALGGTLWIWRNGGSGAEVLQNKNLQDLIEVLNSGTVQVLLVVIKRVPHRGKGGGDKVKDPNTCREAHYEDHQREQHSKGNS